MVVACCYYCCCCWFARITTNAQVRLPELCHCPLDLGARSNSQLDAAATRINAVMRGNIEKRKNHELIEQARSVVISMLKYFAGPFFLMILVFRFRFVFVSFLFVCLFVCLFVLYFSVCFFLFLCMFFRFDILNMHYCPFFCVHIVLLVFVRFSFVCYVCGVCVCVQRNCAGKTADEEKKVKRKTAERVRKRECCYDPKVRLIRLQS